MRHNLDNVARIFIREMDSNDDNYENSTGNNKYSMSTSVNNSPSIESDKSGEQTV